jgi:predicted molibdopterin-dependent oxidoreductase YjgC
VRIDSHPILRFSHDKRVPFYLDGKRLYGYLGEPIAAALLDNGIKVLSRSRRYHRPRGLFCAVGNCCSCLMTVDGRANVRTCVTSLRDGMRVETQSREAVS